MTRRDFYMLALGSFATIILGIAFNMAHPGQVLTVLLFIAGLALAIWKDRIDDKI